MSQYANLKAAIAANVYENHNNEVTANMVKAAMDAMTDSLGAGYQYLGIATPTSPGTAQTPDQKVFYIATTPGTYTYLGGLVVNDGEVAILKWDTAWSKETLDIPSKTQIMARLAAQDAQIAVQDGRLDGQDQEIADFEEAVQNQVDNYPMITINGNVTNAPDEEDITSDANDLLKFKNRSAVDGMGYVILRKGGDNTFANQVTAANTIYEIRYDFDLGGASVTIPSGCVLKFVGGSLSNGTIVGTSTQIIAPNVKIFETTLSLSGDFLNQDFIVSWYGATPSADKTSPVDAYFAIQKSLDVNVANGLKSVRFPAGLWYTSQTLVMSVIKNLTLDGQSNTVRLQITADKSCAVLFADQDIDVLVIDQRYPHNTQLGLDIIGGQFDVSLVTGYSHAVIKFTDSFGETKLRGVNIKTAICASQNSVLTESKGIYIELLNGGYLTEILTECEISFLNYGITDNIVSPAWATSLTDKSVISCTNAIKLSSLYSVFCYGAFQAIPYFSTNNLAVVDISSSGVVCFHGFFWDVNIGSGSAKTQRYSIKGYPGTKYYLLPEVLRQMDKDTILNIEYVTLATNEYAPNRRVAGASRANGYAEIENALLDDGSFAITSECAEGMRLRWVENAFSTKGSRPARFDFGTATEETAYIKLTITFAAVANVSLFGFIMSNYKSARSSSFKKCRVRMFNNSSTEVYNKEIDLTQNFYNTNTQFSIPLITETAVKSMEFYFYEATIRSSYAYGELLSIFARARGTGNSANHKYITTEGRGLTKIFNSAGTMVENFELPRSGQAANRPTTGLYVGFEYFDISLTPKRPIYWDGTGWVDATGASV